MSSDRFGDRARYIPTLTEIIGKPGQGGASSQEPEHRPDSAAQANAEKSLLDTPFDDDVLKTISPVEEFPAPAGAGLESRSAAADSVLPMSSAYPDVGALTDRIVANARARLERELERSIQDDIIPLVDQFTEQLITRLHDNLAHSLREALTSATSEELERLRKSGQGL